MRRFLTKIILFVCSFSSLILIGVLLPTTPRSSKSLFFSKIQKDNLLRNQKPPRLIFVGGSNIGLGLNSQILKDSLKVNPINTSIDAGLGLIFMLDQTMRYIRNGDMIIVIPEYHQLFGEFAFGSEDLIRLVLDVCPEEYKNLRLRQIFNTLKFIPKYALTKFKITEYYNVKVGTIQSVGAFNQYGDSDSHWGMSRRRFEPFREISEPFNYSVLSELIKFDSAFRSKGAMMFVTFPGFQDISYRKSINAVHMVEEEFRNSKLNILGSSQRYMMPDSLMFNTPYHLIKSGVDYRTNLLLEDLRGSTIIQQILMAETSSQ